MITETRKAIIRLIEPYMDKTLSEGCLYKFEDEIYSMSKGEALNSSAFLESQEAGDTNILGHYDITAVLKYIDIHGYKFNNSNCNSIKIHFSEFKDYYIPYKPLHLYTEEEDQALLELLLKLKKYDI